MLLFLFLVSVLSLKVIRATPWYSDQDTSGNMHASLPPWSWARTSSKRCVSLLEEACDNSLGFIMPPSLWQWNWFCSMWWKLCHPGWGDMWQSPHSNSNWHAVKLRVYKPLRFSSSLLFLPSSPSKLYQGNRNLYRYADELLDIM